jgi:hypothetical protein
MVLLWVVKAFISHRFRAESWVNSRNTADRAEGNKTTPEINMKEIPPNSKRSLALILPLPIKRTDRTTIPQPKRAPSMAALLRDNTAQRPQTTTRTRSRAPSIMFRAMTASARNMGINICPKVP